MKIFRTQFTAMASTNEIVVGDASEAQAKVAMTAAAEEVLRIEAKYSRYREDSVVSRINAAAGSGHAVACDDETSSLLQFADTLYRDSSGLFDITSGILRRAWDFATPSLPAAETLARLLEHVGWSRVQRDDAGVRLPEPGMELDFGGFGKEYAADRAAFVLRQQGIRNGYVNLGGDITAVGPQPDGSPWIIGINDPRDPARLIATIPLTEGALATSGDYERFFELDGQRYCHILNPRTGMPVNAWRSVSVLAPVCIAAGSLATIAMLKEGEAVAFLRERAVTYLAVNSQGELHNDCGGTLPAEDRP